jgi:hypothetical protein
MKSTIEFYLQRLDELAGTEGQSFLVTDKLEKPPVWVIIYHDSPERGSLTAFTYGLSSSEHPDWKLGYPELMICVDSRDLNWGLAIGHLAKTFRGQSPFTYESIYRFGEKIAKESEMSAFVVFAPSIVEQEDARIELPDRTINLVQMYPIYEEEIDDIKFEGFPKFLNRIEDVYDVKRKRAARVW